MPLLSRHWEHLTKSVNSRNEMTRSTTILERRDKWHDYLTHLNRIWGAAQQHYRTFEGWDEFSLRYEEERAIDPLLLYLIAARNQVDHGMDEVQAIVPGNIKIEAHEEDGPFKAISGIQIHNDGSMTKAVAEGGRPGSGPRLSYELSIVLLPVAGKRQGRGKKCTNHQVNT